MPEPEESKTEVFIGGVDMNEALAAHREHPELSRWRRTSQGLISDIYEQLERANGLAKQLQDDNAELQKQLEDKKPKPRKVKKK